MSGTPWLRSSALVALPVACLLLAVPAQAQGPEHLAGRVVDSDSGRAVFGATVSSWDELGTTQQLSTVSNPGGHFRVFRVVGEEHALFVEGPDGYESGWLSCPPYEVVPTSAEACTHAPGNLGRIPIDRL